jgi:hypothetical protein
VRVQPRRRRLARAAGCRGADKGARRHCARPSTGRSRAAPRLTSARRG